VALKDTGTYTVTAANSLGSVTSPEVMLTVLFPPSITTQPVSQTKWAGDSITFTVTAIGKTPFSYQWKKGSADITGATSDSYTYRNINYPADNGETFSCVVTNTDGSISSSPAILTIDAIKMVAAGNANSLILKTDGTLWACGANFFGQLGDSTTTGRTTPKLIMSGVSSVAARYEHSLILKTDGTLWACGYNNCGQLGDGTKTNRSIPVSIATGVASIAQGMTIVLF